MIKIKIIHLVLFIPFFSISLTNADEFETELEKFEANIEKFAKHFDMKFEGVALTDGVGYLGFYDDKNIIKLGKSRRMWSIMYNPYGDPYKGKKVYLTKYYREYDCIDSYKILSMIFYEGNDINLRKVIDTVNVDEMGIEKKVFLSPGSDAHNVMKKVCS